MRTLRRLSVALVFTLAFAIPALAGEIDTTITSPPPSQAQSQAATTDGGIETTVAGQAGTGSSETTSTGSATEAALNLLQSVLSLI
jgi:hypothetical protein